MNKSLFKKSSFNLSSISLLKTGQSVALTMITLLLGVFSVATVTAQCTLVCNNNIQVSLDETCQAEISFDMMLENPQYPEADYVITVMTLNDVIVPNGIVTSAHIGMTLQVSVLASPCGISCWGTITVEDKLAPEFTNCTDPAITPITVSCNGSALPSGFGGSVVRPTAVDACDSNLDYQFFDVETSMDCTSGFVKSITRTWIATDDSGMSTSCDQTILVERASLADVTFPADVIEPISTAVCLGTLDTLANGAPNPTETGFPTNVGCSNIQYYHEDIVFELCGAGIKVFRQWFVIDWCTGQEATSNQTIKYEDNAAPVCTELAEDFSTVIPTDGGKCTGTYTGTAPKVLGECSGWTYDVGYKTKDENGDPFENPIMVATGLSSDQTFTITNLPADTSWIAFFITDECGNGPTMCNREIVVRDMEKPTPACEGFTVTTLSDDGWAEVFATSFDDSSWDNCGVDYVEVRRENSPCGIPADLSFGESVNFCCADVLNSPVKVILRVYDINGNYNDCVINVTVDDKNPPIITCPQVSFTFDCKEDLSGTSKTGVPTITDECITNFNTHFRDFENFNDCGIGSITRRWYLGPNGDFSNQICTQFFTITDSDPLQDNDVVFPSNITFNGCTSADITPETLNSFPTINNDGCHSLAISFDDEVFIDPNACRVIKRLWRVADWCTFDASNPSYITGEQLIFINNNTAPVFTSSCNSVSVDAVAGQCEATVELVAVATDDCTPDFLLDYSYEIDFDNNGSVNATGNSNNASGVFPVGTHRITFVATDDCDNSRTCQYLFTVRDNKNPVPICFANVVWTMDSDGTATVWASDFNIKSEDSCSNDSDLTFAFNSSGSQTSLSFDCSDIPNGIAADISLDMYVIDGNGNYDFCTVILTLQDNVDACTDLQGAMAALSGSVTTFKEEALLDAEVQLDDMNVGMVQMEMTNDDGLYSFNNVPFYNEYEIAPIKNDDTENGVSTLDLVLIQKHILSITPFTEAHQIIAADINNSGGISAIDLLELRKVILGINTEFSNNTSWRFVREDHEFVNPLDPFGYPESITYSTLYTSEDEVNFVGIKIGDVNQSAKSNIQSSNSENKSVQKMELTSTLENSNEAGSYNLSFNDDRAIYGLQLAIDLPADFGKQVKIESELFNVTEANYDIDKNGLLRLSLHSADLVELESEVPFIKIIGGTTESNIELNDIALDAEVYDEYLQVYNIVLSHSTLDSKSQDEIISTPNPFSEFTNIEFSSELVTNAKLQIYDVNGKMIKTIKHNTSIGKNTIVVSSDQLNGNGIYYYTLSTEKSSRSGKMILIK